MAKNIFAISIILFSFASCSKYDPCENETKLTSKPEQMTSADIKENQLLSFYALGDQGMGSADQQKVADLIAKDLQNLSYKELENPPFILGLGDNLYGSVWPQGWENKAEAESLLERTFGSIYKDLNYKKNSVGFYLIPGNHDHDGDLLHLETTGENLYSPVNSSGAVLHYLPMSSPNVPDTNDQAEYEGLAKLNRNDISLPEEVSVSSDIIQVIALDTQLILELFRNDNKEALAKQWSHLEKLINSKPNVGWRFIIGHHPIISHGTHGLPLTRFQKFKSLIVDEYMKDQSNPYYQQFIKSFKKVLERNKVDFYLSGHDHDLELIGLSGGAYQVVSGAGSTTRDVISCADTIFAKKSLGFVRFDISKNWAILKFSFLENDQELEESYRFKK